MKKGSFTKMAAGHAVHKTTVKGAEMYTTQCSLPALMDALAREGAVDEPLAYAVEASDSRPFEPFALVILNNYVLHLRESARQAVKIASGKILPPVRYRRQA